MVRMRVNDGYEGGKKCVREGHDCIEILREGRGRGELFCCYLM